MARTTYSFRVHGDLLEDLDLYLTKQGFKKITEKGENIYRKSVSAFSFVSLILEPPSTNLKIQVRGNNAVMEAWFKEAGTRGREMAINKMGIIAYQKTIQQLYNDIVNYIENY